MIFFFFLRKALVFSATLFRSTRQVDRKLEMGCIFKGHFKVEYLELDFQCDHIVVVQYQGINPP